MQRSALARTLGDDTEVPCRGGPRRYVNLDHAASTPVLAEVWEAVEAFAPRYSSVHRGSGHLSQTATAAYEAARGQGVGRALLEALSAAAERDGFYKLTSRIFPSNAASRAVHRAAGFDEVGIQRRHGRLDGEWRDCVLVERLLGDAAR